MKKEISFLTAAVLILFTAGTTYASGGLQSSAASGGKTISLYTWSTYQKPATEEVTALYEKRTGNKVEHTIMPSRQYWTKLQTSLASGEPDVFWGNYPHKFDYYSAGLVEDLQPYIDRDKVDLSHFPQSLREMYAWNGHTYGIPKDYDTIALFYNKALFDAKGVSYPTNNWTWDDLRRAAKQLTDTAKGVHGIAMDATDTQAGLFPLVDTAGGSVLSPDGTTFLTNTPQVIETLKFLIAFSNEDHSSPNFAEMQELNAFERFLAGKAAMIISGSYDAGDFYEGLGDSLAIAKLPVKSQDGNCIHGLAFQVNAYSKNKEAAWELVKLFASKEAGDIMGSLVISAYSGAEKVFINAFPKLDIQLFVDAVKYADPLATPSIGSSAQSSALSTMLEKVWTGADIAQAVAELDAECKKIAAEYKK